MLKDNWEEKHENNLPVHATLPKGIQGSHVGNMILQTHQGFSHNDYVTGSSSRSSVESLTLSKSTSEGSVPSHSNLHSINQPSSMEPVSSRHQFDSVDSNLQGLIKFLSANYGPMKTPLEVGTPEYMKLVEILKQNPGQLNVKGKSLEDVTRVYRDNQEKLNGNGVKNNSSSENSGRVSTEKLWEGTLQLSSSVTLSAVAFFKSGEILVGHSWPESIEVKGKVRLEAFDKYVQDLPRSKNRGLMVTSVCWNEESSNIGLAGMKEVTKGYKKSSRVGFAHLLPGIDLYICPRSDPIITILAKYGFFKGMAVIDDKPDSMIGCVVWRKTKPVNPVGNTSDTNKASPDSIHLSSPPGFSTKQEPSPEKAPPKTSLHNEHLTLPLTTPLTTSFEVDHNRGNCSSSSSSLQNSISAEPCNPVTKRPFVDDDLPEFDFTVPKGKSTPSSQPAILGNNNFQKLNDTRLTQLSNNTHNGSLDHSSKKIKLFDVDVDEDMPEWCPPKLHQIPPQITTTNFATLPPCPPPQTTTTNFATLPPCPPKLHQMPPQTTTTNFATLPPCTPKLHQMPPQTPTTNFANLPPCPPRLPLPPPPPPPPRADTRSSFSHQSFRPPVSSQPTAFIRPPLPPLPPPPRPLAAPLPRPLAAPPPVALWHQPGSFNANRPFLPSNGRHSQL
ncbi:uncharacterized protein [Rutidosis leptorrhynchoides]